MSGGISQIIGDQNLLVSSQWKISKMAKPLPFSLLHVGRLTLSNLFEWLEMDLLAWLEVDVTGHKYLMMLTGCGPNLKR